jgi:CelD/BcsL family acetyltransferase involved in cellulose biosynthesis
MPADWESLLAGLSKSHRKQLRRIERAYAGRTRLVTARTSEELATGFALLVDLHNRRWAERGIEGVFASPELYAFHREATQRLLAAGQLRLSWLEVDGQPASADYALTGGRLIYAYQAGIDPSAAAHEPGTLAMIATLQELLAGQGGAIDFLRGDESYKQHWRATPRPMHDVRILPGDLPGRLRQSIWQAATGAKDWLRASRDAMFGAPSATEF